MNVVAMTELSTSYTPQGVRGAQLCLVQPFLTGQSAGGLYYPEPNPNPNPEVEVEAQCD